MFLCMNFPTRLLEVMTNRIVDIFTPEKPVSELYPQRVYRVEVSVLCLKPFDVVKRMHGMYNYALILVPPLAGSMKSSFT